MDTIWLGLYSLEERIGRLTVRRSVVLVRQTLLGHQLPGQRLAVDHLLGIGIGLHLGELVEADEADVEHLVAVARHCNWTLQAFGTVRIAAVGAAVLQ